MHQQAGISFLQHFVWRRHTVTEGQERRGSSKSIINTALIQTWSGTHIGIHRFLIPVTVVIINKNVIELHFLSLMNQQYRLTLRVINIVPTPDCQLRLRQKKKKLKKLNYSEKDFLHC